MRAPGATHLLIALALLPRPAPADVDHVVIERREPVDGGRVFGAGGAYERISGRIYFCFDPKNPANARVVDLDLAPRGARGVVEACADFVVLRPVNPALGNGFALLEVVNRGATLAPDAFERCSAGLGCRSAHEVGDAFLLRHGYTVIWVGWQWDAPPNPPPGVTLLALHAPSAGDSIVGLVRTDWTIEEPTRVRPLGHQRGVVSRAYPLTSFDDTTAVLTVRDGPLDERRIVPRADWSFAREDSGRTVPDPTFVRMAAGFQVGKIYERNAKRDAIATFGELPPDALLTTDEVGEWLKVARQQVQRLEIPGAAESDAPTRDRWASRRSRGDVPIGPQKRGEVLMGRRTRSSGNIMWCLEFDPFASGRTLLTTAKNGRKLTKRDTTHRRLALRVAPPGLEPGLS